MSNLKKLKRVVIKEELVELTGDFKSAILLNQLIYWSERRKDADKFLEEEKERIKKYGKEEDTPKLESTDKMLSHGWIYKTAEELSNECMIDMSNATIGRYLKQLISSGWIDERNNPEYKWDRTKQYRVNLLNIQRDLNKLGYALEGYSLEVPIINNFQNENSNFNDENSNFQNEKSTFENEKSTLQNEKSTFENEKAIPEITTKITTEVTTEERPSVPIWDRVKEILKNKLSVVAYKTWIERPIVKVNIINNDFNIYVIDDFSKDIIQQKYLVDINGALESLNINYKINVEVIGE